MRSARLILFMLAVGCAALAVSCGESGGSSQTPAPPTGGGGGGGGGATGPLLLDTVALSPAQTGLPYSHKLLAKGGSGTYTWRITGGVLPNGVTLSAVTGVITGVPRVTGNWTIKLELGDGTSTVTRTFSLLVTAPAGDPQIETQLRSQLQVLNMAGLGPQHIPALNPAQVELGRLLFFDKILSGVNDVACATCHHPTLNNGDRLNLSVGVGGFGGVGPGRTHPAKVFIPRNSMPLFNLTATQDLFWDGRVTSGSPTSGPTQTPEGIKNLPPLEAQALLPLVDFNEMRGTGHALDGLTNDQYRLALLQRLAQHQGYVLRFDAAFGAGGMTVNNLVRAIAAWERSQTFINSAWDRYLRGENDAMTDQQKEGAMVFFGRAGCNQCHAGPLLSNFSVHNLGIPQFGPGHGNGPSGREDFGAQNVTGLPLDRYAFRVPPLRNVAFTAPYMHNGAFETLEEVIQHYRDKDAHTLAYTGQNLVQAADLVPTLLPVAPVLQDLSIPFTFIPSDFTAKEMADLKAFLEALTDPAAINRTQEVPQAVPSGLPIDQGS